MPTTCRLQHPANILYRTGLPAVKAAAQGETPQVLTEIGVCLEQAAHLAERLQVKVHIAQGLVLSRVHVHLHPPCKVHGLVSNCQSWGKT